jgi:transmembrane sensor
MNRHAMEDPADAAPRNAEEWLARLHSPDRSPQDEEAFERWRAADPEHAAAYAEVEYLHRHAARLAGDPLLRAVARAARRDLVRRAPARPSRSRWAAIGLAACALLAVGVTQMMTRPPPTAGQTLAAGTGLPHTVTLDDGTRVALDAQTSLLVRFDARQREVILRNGRAQFQVAHDPARPFVVMADGNVIHDIGTTFQVSRQAGGVTVGLLEGRVSVSRENAGHHWMSELAPAQQLHVDADGRAGPVMPLDVASARGWTRGELAFDGRRLDDLLHAMNRYSVTQLRLGAPALASLKVSGSFRAGDQEALASALVQGWNLRVERTGAHELTLLPGRTR